MRDFTAYWSKFCAIVIVLSDLCADKFQGITLSGCQGDNICFKGNKTDMFLVSRSSKSPQMIKRADLCVVRNLAILQIHWIGSEDDIQLQLSLGCDQSKQADVIPSKPIHADQDIFAGLFKKTHFWHVWHFQLLFCVLYGYSEC